jgi:repressor LexA
MGIEETSQKIYNYLRTQIQSGNIPTIREICVDLEIKSTSTVHRHLRLLDEKGVISFLPGKKRSIHLKEDNFFVVPLVGIVTAGEPILAVENIEGYIPMPFYSDKVGDDFFALRIKGDSMINAAILNGDIIIVKKTPSCENGQIAVAMIDGEATVKRFYKENGMIRLQPENDLMEPIFCKNAEVLGTVVSVIRNYNGYR